MDRQTLLATILDELSSHDTGKALHTMRHWPGGRLSMVHLNVLFILDADGPLPMRGLAEAMDVSQASATGIVDRMEQRGLIGRERDEADRRVVRVAITDEGRRLISGMASERRDHMAKLLGEFSDEELGAFLAGARAMRRARERLFSRMHPTSDDAQPPEPAPTTSVTPPSTPTEPQEAPR